MKKAVLLMLAFYCFSCKESEIPSYYFSTTTNEIIKLDGGKINLFNFSDSTLTTWNCKILDKEMIQINHINYRYNKKKDSLIIFDFPDDQELFNERLVLAKFDYNKILNTDLNNKSWSMKIDRKDWLTETSYIEEQIIKIENDLFASYIKEKDTILGAKYLLDSNLLNEFLTYKLNNHQIIIPIQENDNGLKVILYNDLNQNRTYRLNRIK